MIVKTFLVSNSKRIFHSKLALSLSTTPRIPSGSTTLDIHLLANTPELVISHLHSRNASEEIMKNIQKFHDLKLKKSDYLTIGDSARSQRKSLSQSIGKLIKENKQDEVTKLKQEVDKCIEIANEADQKLAIVEKEITTIFSVIPNLLDDR